MTKQEIKLIKKCLKSLEINFYLCENCDALHLIYLQNHEGIFDARLSILDNILNMEIILKIKTSSIVAINSELSDINASTHFSKIYLTCSDNSAKLIFSYSLHMSDDLNLNFFSLALASFEEESLSVINELNQCQFIINENKHIEKTNINFHETLH